MDPRDRRARSADLILLLWSGYTCAEAIRYFLAEGTRGRFHVESRLMILAAACLLAPLVLRREGEGEPKSWASFGLWPALALATLVAALFWPALGLGLLSDDFVLLSWADAGHWFGIRTDWYYRPIPLLLWAAIGNIPFALHGVNVLLHAVNSVMVGQLATQMGLPRGAAWSAGAFFAAFPAVPEAVAWASGIQDVLLTSAGLAFVLCWNLRTPILGRLMVATCALLVGLGSKETAVCFPALALALMLGSKRIPKRDLLWLGGVSVAVVASFVAWRLQLQPLLVAAHAEPLTRWRLKEILVRTFGGLGAPWHQNLGELGTFLRVACGVAWPALLVLTSRAWRGNTGALLRAARLSAWVLLSVAPVHHMLFVGQDLQGSRYLYLPAAGAAILLADALEAVLGSLHRRIWLMAATLPLLLVCALTLRLHLGPWREAARLRDEVLASAERRLATARCDRATFEGVPDSVDGAYVFRNGFPEALRRRVPHWEPGGRCRFLWNGTRFTRLR